MSDLDVTDDGLDRLDLEIEFGCVIPGERGLTSEAAQS
jgi:hypothetical protein